MHRLVPALVAEMGARLSRTGPRAAADRGDAAAGGDAVPPDARPTACSCSTRRPAAMAAGDTLPGETAFKLYDTFGFPYDLTEDALRAQGMAVDRAGFDAAMAEQKRAARAAWKGSGAKASDDLWFDIAEESRRDRVHRLCRRRRARAQVVALVKDGARVDARRRGRHGRRSSSTRRPSTARAAARSAMPARSPATRACAPTSPTRRSSSAASAAITRRSTAGEIAVGDAVQLAIDVARRARDPRQPLARRTCCTRRCASGWARMSRRRARWSRPTGCASTSRTRRR